MSSIRRAGRGQIVTRNPSAASRNTVAGFRLSPAALIPSTPAAEPVPGPWRRADPCDGRKKSVPLDKRRGVGMGIWGILGA